MSIVNCYVGQDHALIGVDTLAGLEGSADLHPSSKLGVVPHLGLIIAARGQLHYLHQLVANIQGLHKWATLDAGSLISDFGQVMAEVAQAGSAAGFPPGDAELVIAGYSRPAGRVIAWSFIRREGQELVSNEIAPGALHAAPVCPEYYAMRAPVTAAHMIGLMQAQCHYVRASYPTLPVGGGILFGRVEQHGVTIRDGGPLA